MSGGTQPTWNTTPGGLTPDNNITWVNAGAFPINALASTGGTSGIIIANCGNSPVLLLYASRSNLCDVGRHRRLRSASITIGIKISGVLTNGHERHILRATHTGHHQEALREPIFPLRKGLCDHGLVLRKGQ